MAEVVGAGKAGAHLGLLRDLTRERPQGLEPADEHVLVPLHALEAAVREDQRLAADDPAMALVDARRDDQVDRAELVLDQHEDDAVRRRRPLARDRHPGDRDARAVGGAGQLLRREHALGEVRAEQLQRMYADREVRRPVVGEHLLPDRRLGEIGCRRSRVEWERELALLPTGAGDAARARDETELPKELAPWQAEAVAGAGDDQRLEALLRELRPLGEVADARERAAALTLLDERLGVL